MNVRSLNPTRTLALLALVAACGDSNPPAENAQERQALLTSVTDNVILPAYQRLATSTDGLATATDALAAAIGTAGTAEQTAAREAAEAAFVEAYEAMQYAELLQIGPYGPASRFEGGRNIRDEIYSWPVVRPCSVDQKLVDEAYVEADFFEKSLVNVYGFDALEYLLMHRSPDNSCAAPADINTSDAWTDLGADEVERRRAEYAKRVAQQIADDAASLLEAWTSGFADELRGAGNMSSVYRSSQAGLDALFASIFYVDTMVKDRKLAGPLGRSTDCAESPCPDLLESQFADLSLVAIEANLRALQDIYYGGPDSAADRFGFGDLLRASNAAALADSLEDALSLAVSRAPLVSEPMREALTTEPPQALFDAVKGTTDILKSQFVSVLALRVPNEGAADND